MLAERGVTQQSEELHYTDPQFHRLINYIQPTGVVRMWGAFDHERCRRDFRQLRHDGISVIRVLPPWYLLQPEPDTVSQQMLDTLVFMANEAKEQHLLLMPTALTAHLGGYNELPVWAYDTKTSEDQRFTLMREGVAVNVAPKNCYEDSEIINAQLVLVSELAKALGNHPALWGYNIANELTNFSSPSSTEVADRWLASITSAIRRIDNAHPIIIGHSQWDIEQNRNFGLDIVGRHCNLSAMHVYPRYGELPKVLEARKVIFYALLTQWLSGKPVFLEEFGEPTTPLEMTKVQERALDRRTLPESTVAKYSGEVFNAGQKTGLVGAGIWCSTDVMAALDGEPPYSIWPWEKHFGIRRVDGSAKPVIPVLQTFIGMERGKIWKDFSWIDNTGITQENFYHNPIDNLQKLYPSFAAYYDTEITPLLAQHR